MQSNVSRMVTETSRTSNALASRCFESCHTRTSENSSSRHWEVSVFQHQWHNRTQFHGRVCSRPTTCWQFELLRVLYCIEQSAWCVNHQNRRAVRKIATAVAANSTQRRVDDSSRGLIHCGFSHRRAAIARRRRLLCLDTCIRVVGVSISATKLSVDDVQLQRRVVKTITICLVEYFVAAHLVTP